MAETTLNPSTKRSYSESNSGGLPHKRRKVRRVLHHVQSKPQDIEPAPQDPVSVQGQLLRSIGAALTAVGFDSVKPTALEVFRSHVEEYMLQFLHYARTSMSVNRRTKPTAQDFASALSLTPNTSSASLLTPQLSFQVPADISYPSIPQPDPPPAPASNFSALLEPLLSTDARDYIPKHFPILPPKHAWVRTPVYPERESDARKIREKATEEGILAEQALRKLAAAAKTGAVKAEKRKMDVLSGPGRKVEGASREKTKKRRDSQAAEAMFASMLKETGGDADIAAEDEVMDLGTDGVNELREEGVDVGMPEGVVVNWDMGGWRRGGKKALRF